MERSQRSALRTVVLVVDALLVAVSMGAAYGAHALLHGAVPYVQEPPTFSSYAAVAYLALPLWLLLVVGFGAHRFAERISSRLDVVQRLLKVHVFGLVSLLLAVFLTQSVINRTIVALFLVASFTLMYVERRVVTRWIRHQHERGHGRVRLLLVGAPGPAMQAFAKRARSAELPAEIVGRLCDEAHDGPSAATGGQSVPPPGRLGDVSALAEVLSTRAVDEVLFFPPYDDPRDQLAALDACETVGVPASFALDVAPVGRAAPLLRRTFDHSFLSYEATPKSPTALAVKHTLDVVLAAILILLASPVLLIITLVVLVGMGRPVLFLQRRAGLRGREFTMLKFRTMVSDAEAQKGLLADKNEMSGPVFKVTDDPRVTRLGKWLRRTSLDELPQLFNVLTGTMSLVGPRPLPVAEQEQISGWHRRRLSMKPGITCLWQVSGRNDVDFEDWMALDLSYVDGWSLWLDASILLRTVPVVLFGRGAK